MSGLPKTFDPSAIETRWYSHWETSGAFRPHRPGAVPYTIVNPPPNVTGSLHMGHMLDHTLIDQALAREAELDYIVPSGRYWEEAHRFDPAMIDALDSLWLQAARATAQITA